MSAFRKMDITVMLTAEEWFAVMATLGGYDLSAEGCRILLRAASKLKGTLRSAGDAYHAAVLPPSMLDFSKYEPRT
jgi:hypothetical protein